MATEYKFTTRIIENNILLNETCKVPDGIDPETYLKGIVQNFNKSLNPKESPREFVSLDGIANENVEIILYCDLEKQNLVTIKGKGSRTYDILKCKICNKKIKRYGLETPRVICKGKKKK